ncbi:hypothetical protein QQ045_006604 [Rhodiola kirilowii]
MVLIANAGDCRAVLGKRGRAVELSRDHIPNAASERLRIDKLGGVEYDGYLNGQLSVSRALGDWHMKGPRQEPEVEELLLTEEDEFLILGCDGLWDVMSSQCAVTIVRKELMLQRTCQGGLEHLQCKTICAWGHVKCDLVRPTLHWREDHFAWGHVKCDLVRPTLHWRQAQVLLGDT